jgi:hypothetical protein
MQLACDVTFCKSSAARTKTPFATSKVARYFHCGKLISHLLFCGLSFLTIYNLAPMRC